MRLGKICLILCLSACTMLSMRPLSAFDLDVWESEDPLYGILARLDIDHERSQMRAFEVCNTGHCSWGWTKLEPIVGGYVARYQEGNLKYELYLIREDVDRIQLIIVAAQNDEVSAFLSQAHFHREK